MIRLRLPPAAEEHVAASYSPLTECVMSLKVLLQPKRHPLHRRWAREVRRAGAPLQEAFDRYAFAFRDNAPTLYVGGNASEPSLAEELELLGSMPEAQLRFEFTLGLHQGSVTGEQLADRRAHSTLLADGVRDFPASGDALALLLERPRAFIAEFTDFIERYFEQVFAKEWKRIEPLLADSVADAGERIAGDGFYQALAQLNPRLRGDARRRRLVIEKWLEHDYTLRPRDELVFAPSVYVWPNLAVFLEDGPWPKSIIYPAPFLAQPRPARMPPDELVRLLRALGDATRLRMLQLIAQRPRSTQELAPLIGISEATLSRHLRLLTEAGVLARSREGRFVLYRLEADAVARLEPGLRGFLGRGDDDRARKRGQRVDRPTGGVRRRSSRRSRRSAGNV
jgi:DNA-binding transcriptional ArsR family regulator